MESREPPGAPVTAVAPLRCLYCGHARALGHACERCGFEPPRLPCSACGRSVFEPMERCGGCAVPRIAWRTAVDGLACPRCREPLAWLPLDRTNAHIESCARCGGVFTRARDLSELFMRVESGEEIALPSAGGPPGAAATVDRLALVDCPHCTREMDRVRFAQRASLVVDVCAVHGTWHDGGELPALLLFVQERARGVVRPGEVEREDEERWRRIMEQRRQEEMVVSHHLAMAALLDQRRQRSRGDD